jgi:hypothetical protein
MSLECRNDSPAQKGFIMNEYPSRAGRADRGRGADNGPLKGGRFPGGGHRGLHTAAEPYIDHICIKCETGW